MYSKLRVYKSGIHLGEERIVAGNCNSGMINFSGCHLACNFCYTPETSVEQQGQDLSTGEFTDLLDELVVRGARNLNFISPSHVWAVAQPAARRIKAKYGRRLPLILKISGYERQGLLSSMAALGDVFVPDFKVWSPEVARSLNLPEDYGVTAQNAVRLLIQTHGAPQYSDDMKLSSGVLVRHLMMPEHFEDSLDVVEALGDIGFSGHLNLMTYFYDPRTRRIHNANPTQRDLLATKADQLGMSVLINGKVFQSQERRIYA
ncbi:MAG: hypothetical protein KDD39_14285 [Bdellovibrionales bacterium]|nr:hypothetical protein [Bdellovibrionales bacterium]